MPTFNANVLPSSTGFDLGSAAQRWDAFLQQLNVSDIATFSGTTSLPTVSSLNNIRFVTGTTSAAIQAEIDAVGNDGMVWLRPQTYTLTTGITIPYDNIVVFMYGATINVEFNGVGITCGVTGVRHRRIWLYGGTVQHATSGTADVDWTSGNLGVRFFNVSRSAYHDYVIQGFEKGIELKADSGEGTSYHTSYPTAILSCKFPIYIEPTGAGSFVNDNSFMGDGNISYAATDPDATGGYAIYADAVSGANNPDSLKVIGLSLENPTVTAGDPDGAIFMSGIRGVFTALRYEGFASPFLDGDADSTDNVFSWSNGLDGPADHTATRRAFNTIHGRRGTQLAVGDGTNIGLLIREVNSNANNAFRLENASGSNVFNMASTGATVFNEVGDDIDQRIEGDTDPNLLYVDAGNDRVGIGTDTPSVKFDARGSTQLSSAEGDVSNVPRWIFKQVDFGDMTAAATNDVFTLWTLPANTMIHDVIGLVNPGWSGGSISAAVASVGTQAGADNDLTLDDNFFGIQAVFELHDATASGGKGTLLFDTTDKFAPYFWIAGGVIELQMDLTGDNHANATAGQARIYILVSQPFANSTTEAN